MWQTPGHETVKKILELQLQQGRLSHAYLFVGPKGVGKKMLAEEVGQKILVTKILTSHPDYLSFDVGADTGLEDLRQFMSRLSTKPFVAQYKLALINNFEQASTQMQNALLKTLEEPSPSTVIILIAAQRNALPTIVSRCQVLSFNPVNIKQLLESSETLKDSLERIKQLDNSLTLGPAEKLLVINELAELENAQLREILLAWLAQSRQKLAAQPGLVNLMNRISEALQSLQGTFNKKMVLQRLLLAE
jgi:DNA polymerase III subunit delta'